MSGSKFLLRKKPQKKVPLFIFFILHFVKCILILAKKAAEDAKAALEKTKKDTKYKKISGCAKAGTVGNWKVYIYEKNAATSEDDCKTACTGADEAGTKKCDFFIFKSSECWLGDFERGETTILAAASGLDQPVDINYKECKYFLKYFSLNYLKIKCNCYF